ncbi:MAG: ATP-binding protein [Thermoleophilaceae bacterium]
MTLVFALVMALVLTVTGLFMYVRFRSELDGTIYRGLRSRTADVVALVQQADRGLAEAVETPGARDLNSFAQIIDRSGKIVDSTPRLRQSRLLTPAELTVAERRTLLLEHSRGEPLDYRSRLLATAAVAQGKSVVVVVGASLRERDRALANLATLLLLGGPFALVLASLAGYGVAAAALRPVESMRRRAVAVTSDELEMRLPVPPARDEISRLGTTLNEMLARLEEAFARERTFVADASHELRTPLAILKAELELASSGRRSREDLDAAIRSAADEVDRLTQLAEDLLVLARVEQGRLPIRRSEILVQALLATVRARVRDSDRELTLSAPEGLRIDADQLRLEQALGNLVDNALRYAEGPVTLRAAAREGSVELHVEDEGPGFPQEYLPEAFKRFSRGGVGGAGAGLGLSIVEAIAVAHDGSVGATNGERGADVWIAIPTRPAPPPSGRVLGSG